MHNKLLPPSPFIKRFAKMLSGNSLDVLDIGCSIGRNSLYLAMLGHKVVGVGMPFSEVQHAAKSAQAEGLDCRFVVGDARALMFAKKFGAVLINEVLHQVPKHHSADIIKGAQEATAIDGLNVVSGYIVDPIVEPDFRLNNYLQPKELLRAYKTPGWDVINYTEEPTSCQYIGNSVHVGSLATIIAQRTS